MVVRDKMIAQSVRLSSRELRIIINDNEKMKSIVLYSLMLLATLASGVGKKKKLSILIFHRVLDDTDYMRPGEVDKKAFTWQMQLLAKYFNVLSLTEALAKLESNELPPRAACITFDDGYADNYLNALPILKRYKLNATFFIATAYIDGGIMWNDKVIEGIRNNPHTTLSLPATDFHNAVISTEPEKQQVAQQIISHIKHLQIERRESLAQQIADQASLLPTDLMMSSEQLRLLHQSGMEIGGHTVTHPILAKLTEDQARIEIIDNKKELEKILDTTIHYFAYPNGKPGQDYLKEQIEIVKQASFKAALSTQWGVSTVTADKYQLPRFTPWDAEPVKFMLRMIYIMLKK